jgi:hypothetical protein
MTTALIRKLSPDTLALKEIGSEAELAIMEKVIAVPTLATAPSTGWKLNLSQEVNMTNDSHLFQTEAAKGSIPLYEGGMFWQFDGAYREPRYFLKLADARAVVPKRGAKHTFDDYQLVFRAIASATNERTLISAVLRKMVVCNNNVAVSTSRCMGQQEYPQMVYIMGVTNSFVLDWFVRLEGAIYLKFSSLEGLPVPRLTEGDKWFADIVHRAARLICTTPEYDDLAKEVGLGSHKNGATDPGERARLRAELDGIVAHLYGLTEDEFVHILGTFPLVKQDVKDAALKAFQDLAPIAGDVEVADLIKQGEGAHLEFKSTARWNVRENKQDKVMEDVIRKTVAAFLNSEGGTLLIGVEDNGNVLGLDLDMKTLGKKQDRDGYELFLTSILHDHFGKDVAPSLKVTFHTVDGKDVCRITIQRCPRLVYVRENNDDVLYIRAGNSTKKLSTKEAVEYAANRKSGGPS